MNDPTLYFTLVLVTLFITGCQSNKVNEGISVRVVNDSLFSYSGVTAQNLENVLRYDNYLCDSLFTNTLEIVITNNSKSNQSLFLKKKVSLGFDNSQHYGLDMHFYNLDQRIDVTKKSFFINRTIQDSSEKRFSRYCVERTKNRSYIFNSIFDSDDGTDYYITLKPNESKTYYYYLTLPIIQMEGDLYHIPCDGTTNYFELSLNFSKDGTDKHKSKDSHVFIGQVKSNMVPVKCINVP
ncbi:MAG: hypothetical protein ACK4RM_00715 [Flavobacterium sp.]